MKRTKFSEAQIAFVLKQAEEGKPTTVIVSPLMGVPFPFDPSINLLAVSLPATVGVLFGHVRRDGPQRSTRSKRCGMNSLGQRDARAYPVREIRPSWSVSRGANCTSQNPSAKATKVIRPVEVELRARPGFCETVAVAIERCERERIVNLGCSGQKYEKERHLRTPADTSAIALTRQYVRRLSHPATFGKMR